jgi:hypothetical protein
LYYREKEVGSSWGFSAFEGEIKFGSYIGDVFILFSAEDAYIFLGEIFS